MRVVVTGPDPEEFGSALEEAGATVTSLNGAVTAAALAAADIETTDLIVLTDPGEATAIPLAREAHPDIRVVVYADTSLPPFATHLADLIVDPDAVAQSVVIEEVLPGVAEE